MPDAVLTGLGCDTVQGVGSAVATANGVILVSDPYDDGPLSQTGAVYVYRDTDGTWTLEQVLKPTIVLNDVYWFGYSVAIDDAGDTAVVGAIKALGFDKGAAYVFEHDGTQWIETAELVADPPSNFAQFGYAVAISEDGDTLAVGAPFAGGGGATHFYRRIGNQWIEVLTYTPLVRASLGAAMSFEGDTALVADPGIAGVHVFAGVQDIDCNGNGQPDGCDIAPGTGTSFDSNANGVPDECEGVPDFNGDGDVGPADLADLLAGWGKCRPPKICAADLNMDGSVGPADLAQLLALWGQIIIPPLCPASAESCCAAHDSPGCGDSQCCGVICEIDAFCCELSWDAICVNEAQAMCGCAAPATCGEGGAGPCCMFGLDPNRGPGCNDPACCESICDYIDPYCCQVQWDESCVAWADQVCASCPPVECSPESGPCCNPTFLQGCNDADCCVLICAIDNFCCDIGWDHLCAEQAAEFCEVCGGSPPGE